MVNILEKICADKKIEIEQTKKRCSLNTLKKLISNKINKRNFKETIIEKQINGKNFIIGEIKKRWKYHKTYYCISPQCEKNLILLALF